MKTRITAAVCALMAFGGIAAVATSRAQSPGDLKSAALEQRIASLEKQVTELREDMARVRSTQSPPVGYQLMPTTHTLSVPAPGRQPDYYFNGQPVYRILLDGQTPAAKK